MTVFCAGCRYLFYVLIEPFRSDELKRFVCRSCKEPA